jgi:hypothetical protein
MLNERQTTLVLEEAMRGNVRFWERQGYDEREAFIKAIEEIEEMTTDPRYPCGEKLDVATKQKFIEYRKLDLGL